MTYVHAGTIGLQPGNPQPGTILAGVIERYTSQRDTHSLVWTVIVTEEQTGEQGGLRLVSTHVLVLFAQYQPYPGERIDMRYVWHAPDHSSQRWRLTVDRSAPLDLSPLGGEASDEAPWHREPRVAIAVAGSTQHP